MSTKNDLSARLDFMEIGSGQRRLLAKMQGRIASLIDGALDRFYTKVKETPETAKFFRDGSHMTGAKRAQAAHWGRIASGKFDGEFYDSVRRIGSVHARIGLEPRWYIGAYALVLEELIRDIGGSRSPLGRLLGRSSRNEAIIAIVKAALLDMEMSVSIYFEESQAEREAAIAKFDKALEGLAEGDLSHDLKGLPAGFTELQDRYNEAIGALRELVGRVTDSADAIRSGTSEIMQASEDLARRTEANAASLEETSASLTEVDGRVKATARAADETLGRANEASASVSEGRTVTASAVQAMEDVSENAQAIDAVIEGLDKIAFQTRVLAMNAAVEAGRAGEAGRGFAVVADLVSALAMRAEEESKSAREQLTLTQTGIGTAVEAVQRVDGALSNIATGVGEVNELLSSMAKDNQAQASALTQVTAAIGDMDKATQQNAAMVEETSAAARNLSSEVGSLSEMAGRFKTGLACKSARAGTNVHRMLPAADEAMQAGTVRKVAANGGGQGDWTAF